MSSSSASGRSAASPRCRSRAPGSRWSAGGGLLAHPARLRSRRAAQQFPRLAAGGAEGERRNPDPPAERVGALFAAAAHSSHDERRRRHLAALLGAELAAQSLGLQGGERDDAALWRLAHAQGFDGGGLAVRARGARALLRQGRARGRRVRARPATSTASIDPPRQHLRGAAQARLSDAAAARHRIHRTHGGRRAPARLARLPGPGGDQLDDL